MEAWLIQSHECLGEILSTWSCYGCLKGCACQICWTGLHWACDTIGDTTTNCVSHLRPNGEVCSMLGELVFRRSNDHQVCCNNLLYFAQTLILDSYDDLDSFLYSKVLSIIYKNFTQIYIWLCDLYPLLKVQLFSVDVALGQIILYLVFVFFIQFYSRVGKFLTLGSVWVGFGGLWRI